MGAVSNEVSLEELMGGQQHPKNWGSLGNVVLVGIRVMVDEVRLAPALSQAPRWVLEAQYF